MAGAPVLIDRNALQFHIWVTKTATHAGLFDLVPILLSGRDVGGAVWQSPIIISVLSIISGCLSGPWIGDTDTAVLKAAPTGHYTTENSLICVPGLRQRQTAKALVWGSLCCTRNKGNCFCLSSVRVFEVSFATFPIPHLLGSSAALFDFRRRAAEHLQTDICLLGWSGPQGHSLLVGLVQLVVAVQVVGESCFPAQHGSPLRHLENKKASSQAFVTSLTLASCCSTEKDLTFKFSDSRAQTQYSNYLQKYFALGLMLFLLVA